MDTALISSEVKIIVVLLLVKSFTWATTMLIWSVVGLYLWFPLVILASTVYLTSTFIAAFSGRPDFLAEPERALNNAANLYQDGFKNLHKALMGTLPVRFAGHYPLKYVFGDFFVSSFLSLLGATMVWLGVYVVMSWIFEYVLQTA